MGTGQEFESYVLVLPWVCPHGPRSSVLSFVTCCLLLSLPLCLPLTFPYLLCFYFYLHLLYHQTLHIWLNLFVWEEEPNLL